MTPREQWEALRDALDRLQAAENRATAAPWTPSLTPRADGGGYIDGPAPFPHVREPNPLPWVGHASLHTDAVLIALLRNAGPALLASARDVVEAHRPVPLGSRCLCAHDPWPCPYIAPLLPLIGGDQ